MNNYSNYGQVRARAKIAGRSRRVNNANKRLFQAIRRYEIAYIKQENFILDTLRSSIQFYGMLYRFAASDLKRVREEYKQEKIREGADRYE